MTCGWCGDQFVTTDRRIRLCSVSCKRAARVATMARHRQRERERAIRQPKVEVAYCAVCSREFVRSRQSRPRVTCSQQCAAMIRPASKKTRSVIAACHYYAQSTGQPIEDALRAWGLT